ncbi:MAG: hypothetical protein IOD12_16435 [Silvanigrellales bacterium]|jgi:hypothetical protein|nr:hypothetical protein [Silvanigrellales bacterium]
MKVVAWGFSMPSLCEAFARELARLPGRNDLILQIDTETRTIDFSSVRVTEFLRTDCRQIESLLRALDVESDVTVVFDMWRFVLSDAFEESIDRAMQVARKASRCLFVSPHRVSHHSVLMAPGEGRRMRPSQPSDAFLRKVAARVLALHEGVLNIETRNSVGLLCTPPPAEGFWSLLGPSSLQPVKRLGVSFAPRELRQCPAAFTSVSVLAREMCRLVAQPSEAAGVPVAPWTEAPATVDVAWPENVRAFDCSWERFAELSARSDASVGGPLPAYVSEGTRSALLRAFHAYAAFEKRRSGDASQESPAMGLLFPPVAEGSRTPPTASV